MSYFYYFNTTELQWYRSLVSTGSSHPACTPIQVILREGRTNQRPPPGYNDGMLMHHQRVRWLTLKRHNIGQIHSHTLLWLNGHMPKLRTIPEPTICATYDVIYLPQVMTTSGPKMFQSLKDEFSIPNHLLFRYLQLCHALQTHFTGLSASLDTPLPEYYIGHGTF